VIKRKQRRGDASWTWKRKTKLDKGETENVDFVGGCDDGKRELVSSAAIHCYGINQRIPQALNI